MLLWYSKLDYWFGS